MIQINMFPSLIPRPHPRMNAFEPLTVVLHKLLNYFVLNAVGKGTEKTVENNIQKCNISQCGEHNAATSLYQVQYLPAQII